MDSILFSPALKCFLTGSSYSISELLKVTSSMARNRNWGLSNLDDARRLVEKRSNVSSVLFNEGLKKLGDVERCVSGIDRRFFGWLGRKFLLIVEEDGKGRYASNFLTRYDCQRNLTRLLIIYNLELISSRVILKFFGRVFSYF
jgi:hypothetical protein